MPAAWGILIALGLDESAAALLGTMLLAAAASLAVLAQSLARKMPWPLNIVSSSIAGAVSLTIVETVRWGAASAQGLATVIQAPWQAIWTVARSGIVASEQLAGALLAVALVKLPALATWTRSLVQSAYLSAVVHADALAHAVTVYAQQLVTAAMQRADVQYVIAITHADQVAAAVANYARQLVGTAIARADAEFTTSVAHADAVGGTVADYARQLSGEVLQFTQVAEGVLRLELEQVRADTLEYARTLEGIAVRHADQVGQAVATGAAAATGAVAARVLQIERSPCQRFCSPLGDLGSLLQQLADAGILALILAMAAEMASDPGGAASAVEQVAGGALRELTDELGAAVGHDLGGLGAFTRFGGPARSGARR